jgi:hypothetical protein
LQSKFYKICLLVCVFVLLFCYFNHNLHSQTFKRFVCLFVSLCCFVIFNHNLQIPDIHGSL